MTKPPPFPALDPDTGEVLGHLKALVSALKRAADLLEVLGAEEFRASAFRGAARSLEGQSETLETLAAREFRRIPKVGPGIAAELLGYVQTGVFAPLAELEAQLPPGVLTLFRVRGLGPKKIRALWEAGIDSLQTLWEAAQDGRLAALKGFGVKSAATLSDAAEFALASQSREFLNTGLRMGEQLLAWLGDADLGDLKPRLSGELRRGLDTISAVRLTVTGTSEDVSERLRGHMDALSGVEGKPLLTGRLEGLPIEIGYAPEEARGALDLTFGGGAAYRQAARARAQERGLTLSGRGLKRGGTLLPTPSERDVLRELDWPELPPEYREDEHWALGPQVLASLPSAEALIGVRDMRALLHTHSTWSDGTASIQAMALEAARLDFGGDGACYLGTGDHSGAAHYANGLDAGRLRQQLREVRELQAAGVPLVAGAEVDILEDGSLDYPDELLAQLDYVVASVHSHFTLDQARQTERLIRAASHPLTTILGHPTGRLLLRRPGYPLDLDAVLAVCAERGTAVEINASPYRLDLDWRAALRWRDRLTFAINTDAHTLGGLADVRYGVTVARKAGLTPQQVVNTLGREAFLAFVRAQREKRN
ncbi:helix-hairpin-helix domain-containing protein [Deinococcus sp.]|uniref:helix-hairpin-helix domain-containing protein n=1 Tax=Deinococcus sp. TaxID=47478 RepID=UPI003CC5EF87